MRHPHSPLHLIAALSGLLVFGARLAWCVEAVPAGEPSLVFDPERYTVQSSVLEGRTISYRAYEGIVYVAHPVAASHQSLNLYVPVGYAQGGSVGGYTVRTAPILLTNSVGGYMPARAKAIGSQARDRAGLVALSKGLVVVAPGARGRTQKDATGAYVGKAPAAIVDLKAAVRYLRANRQRIPGDVERIISNGTSAGGALSALLGASGDHPDYAPYLKAIGAADARDDIFAVSAYCPITDLEHADAAYEWMFCGLNEAKGRGMPMPPPGAGEGDRRGPPPGDGDMPMPPPGAPSAQSHTMSPEQIANSQALKGLFPPYVNSLGLKTAAGVPLVLDAAGNGTFKDEVKARVIASAQTALAAGTDLTPHAWITIRDHTVVDIDWAGFVAYAGRMKTTAAFDGTDLGTGENGLFGTATVDVQHFTEFGQAHTTVPATRADPLIVRLMNPLTFIGTGGATVAKHWRIRHGTIDRDTSLAIPVILATRLANQGIEVDCALPWDRPHSGDYDLDALFAWIARICPP